MKEQPKPQQISWPPVDTYRTPDGKAPKKKYIQAPMDEHVATRIARQRETDIHVAETVLLPILRKLERITGEVDEIELAREAGMFAAYTRRRLLALWRAKPSLVCNRGGGYWESAEHHQQRLARERDH